MLGADIAWLYIEGTPSAPADRSPQPAGISGQRSRSEPGCLVWGLWRHRRWRLIFARRRTRSHMV